MSASRTIVAQPLTHEAFRPFGDVIDVAGAARSYPINGGRCMRHHAVATVETAGSGTMPIINLFRSEPVSLPYALALVERHPFGSQAFMPLGGRPFLVVVADDTGNGPGTLHAFLTAPGQGINIGRNVWHGPLTPLGEEPADFLVVDRSDPGSNLEEWPFEEPWRIIAG